MCDPISMAALATVSTASSISAANSAAESEQDAAIQQQNIMKQQRSLEEEETNRKAGLELTQAKRESLQQKSAATVAAAESGVSGASTLRNLGNVYMQESFKAGSIISLNEAQVARIGVQSQADFVSTRSAIQSAENKKTTGMAAALQIGGSAMQGYAAGGGFGEGMDFDGATKAFSDTWSFS